MQRWTATEAWSYKKKKHKKGKAYRKPVYKDPTVKRCLLILDTKIIGQKKAFYRQRIPESLPSWGKKLLT